VVSNFELASRLGVHIRTVQLHLRELEIAGIILRYAGPSGHRCIFRLSDGSEERYGIDLAPMVYFYIYARKMRNEARQHRAAMKISYRRISAVASRSIQIQSTLRFINEAVSEAQNTNSLSLEDFKADSLNTIKLSKQIQETTSAARRLLEKDTRDLPDVQTDNLGRMKELASFAETLLRNMHSDLWTQIAASQHEDCRRGATASFTRGIDILGIDQSAGTSTSDFMAKKDSSAGESRFIKTLTSGILPSKEGYGRATITIKPSGDVCPTNQTEMKLFGTENASDRNPATAAKMAKAAAKLAARASLPPVEFGVERLLTIAPRMSEMIKISSGGDVLCIEDAKAHHFFDLARFIVIEEFGGTQKIWGEMAKRHGVGMASLAALLTFVKLDHEIKSGNRMAYWLGILRKPAPEIDLVPSIFAVQRRARERKAS